MTPTRRLLAVLACLLVGVGLLAVSTPTATSVQAEQAARAARAKVVLNSVGERYVGDPIPIVGYLSGTGSIRNKTITLQRRAGGSWHSVVTIARRADGRFKFGPRYVSKPQTARWRTVAKRGGRVLDVSNTIAVKVIRTGGNNSSCQNNPSPTNCPQPPDATEQQTVEDAYCQQLVVNLLNQERTVTWEWNANQRAWVQVPGTWATVSQDVRPASATDCLSIVDSVPANALLPDLRIKNLNRCGRGDLDATGGTCFSIIPSAPRYNDFPSLEGKKLLKFPVLTMNVPLDPQGNPAPGGPAEIIADRSSLDPDAWKAYQTFYDAQGNRLGSVEDPGVQFYFAGDSHNHWHVRDFDNYYLLNTDGSPVKVGERVVGAEKHGYCMQDNKTYDPWFNEDGTSDIPGVPVDDPAMPYDKKGVYWETTSCGKGLPNALTIVHGLSKGWGDTYPTTLPDQAIDITGVPDGDYIVEVHADAKGAVIESDNSNNTASMKIHIAGNVVTTYPETATGGIN